MTTNEREEESQLIIGDANYPIVHSNAAAVLRLSTARGTTSIREIEQRAQ
jgi:hypothetical protein